MANQYNKKEITKAKPITFRPSTTVIEILEAHMQKYGVSKTAAIEYYIILGAAIE
jgi:hypothetical protein